MKEAVVVLVAVVDLAVAFGIDKSEFSSGNLNLRVAGLPVLVLWRSNNGESKMLAKKIIMGLLLLATAMPLATTVAFADAPGGAYVQCNGGPSSPVRCTPDSW
jgi:hypothetical protein